MDIKTAFNTPVLATKILNSNTLSTSENGSMTDQIFTINSTDTSYIDNSKIIITDIETYYSDLGLLTPQSATVSINNSNICESTKNIFNKSLPSIYTIPEFRNLYDEIINMLKNSLEADSYVSKETHLLLTLKAIVLINQTFIEYFLSSTNLKFPRYNEEINNLIDIIGNILLSISKSLKSLYTFIGHTALNYTHSIKLSNNLNKSIDLINNLKSSSIFNDNNQELQDSINILDCIEDIKKIDSKCSSFSDFINVCSLIINSVHLILKSLSSDSANKTYNYFSDSIYFLSTSVKLLNHTIYAIKLTNSNIYDNYSLIINEIKAILSLFSYINLTEDRIKLHTDLNTNILPKKSYSKIITKDDYHKTSIKSENKLKESNKKSISKFVQLYLSFYVCNLKINISGTISSKNFSAYIYFPHLINLNYLGINDITLNTHTEINEQTTSLNISQSLNSKLETVSITPQTDYNITTPDNFSADISFLFTLNDEFTITTVLPIVFTN